MKLSDASLADIGFSVKESKVYTALLELGEATIFDIAERSRLNRTTVYPIIYKMLQDRLVKKITKEKKRYFYIEDVRDLHKNIQQKERACNELLPELQALHNILPNKPRVTYYEGEQGVRDFYLYILNSLQSGESIAEYIGDMQVKDAAIKKFTVEEYPVERLKRKIAIKILASPSVVADQWKKSSPQFLREIKIVKNNQASFSANVQIYKNGIGLISYNDNFTGVIIESKDISAMFQSAFELMWTGADVNK